MGEQWPEQLDRAAKEHGWSEKNLKKHYGELKEPWTLDLAKTARVDLKRLWSSYLVLKRWCINVTNPLYVRFLNADLSVPSGTNKDDVMAYMRGVFWLLEEHKKAASAAKRKATKEAKDSKVQVASSSEPSGAPPPDDHAHNNPPSKRLAVPNPNPTRPTGRRLKQVVAAEPQAPELPHAPREVEPIAIPQPIAVPVPHNAPSPNMEGIQITILNVEDNAKDDDEVEVTKEEKDISEMLGELDFNQGSS